MPPATVPSITQDIKRGDKGKPVREVQEWLCLHDFQVGIDEDFGPATELGVTRFQRAKGLPDTGVVTPETFSALVQPMREALAPIPAGGRTLGQMVAAYAVQHVPPHPREIGGENRGPWVRFYMRGQEGAGYFWG
ncbi:MAG: peptidoglycan-binding domain-containing protein, partial [Candidatus Hydrogenedentales bacterium]